MTTQMIIINVLCVIILIGWAIRAAQDKQEIRKAQQEQREKEAEQAKQEQKEAIAAALGVDVEEINELQKQRRESD